eukprot:TRINITY_DN1780_c0_g1_i4.p3 TRINITY_DN1780_c0_g1~~TRINITY_DN1780_c0_g1_i4.p3  ORF type:complete len:125 (-),score=17.84 TRINITY_DN1780_c0_g1_i4:214-588(-)
MYIHFCYFVCSLSCLKFLFIFFFFLMIRRPPRSTHCISSAASDVYKRQEWDNECYHSNDNSVSFNFFSDMSVSYRTSTYEIGLSGRNIFGNKNYEHRYITDNQQIYTLNRLRPREILAKFSFDL